MSALTIVRGLGSRLGMGSAMSNRNGESFDHLERFRPLLSLLVRTKVDRKLVGKVDLSGVVQQTMLDAFQAGDKLDNRSDQEVIAWLRRSLANNLIDEVRRLHAWGRNPVAEVSIEAALGDSSAHFDHFLAHSDLCPSQRCQELEQHMRLAEQLLQLPEPQRRAIELHRLQNRSLDQTAEELGRTKAAIAGLLRRGMHQLRELMRQ
jgi:RNA polymerase sigma-70 factor (ECF subfamily)